MISLTPRLWLTPLLLTLTDALRASKSGSFPLGSEVENLVLRPSPHNTILSIVQTRPELYELPPTADATPNLIHTFPGTIGLSSISHSSTPDIFYVITGNFTWKTISPVADSYAIHKVKLSNPNASNSGNGSTTKVDVTQLATLDALSQPNGMIHVANTDDVLIADTRGGLIHKFDTVKRQLTTYFDHPLLKPTTDQCFQGICVEFGVNGIKLSNGYLYFSNTNRNLIARIKATGKEDCLQGSPEIVATGMAVDDFILNEKNGDLWIAENNSNAVGWLKASEYGGTPRVVYGSGNPNVTEPCGGPTAVRWVRGQEGRTLLVTTTGGFTQFFEGAYNESAYTGGGGVTILHLDQ